MVKQRTFVPFIDGRLWKPTIDYRYRTIALAVFEEYLRGSEPDTSRFWNS